MTMYWRGIWDVCGVHIFPSDELWSKWGVFGFGCTAYLGYFLHPGIDAVLRHLLGDDHSSNDDEQIAIESNTVGLKLFDSGPGCALEALS